MVPPICLAASTNLWMNLLKKGNGSDSQKVAVRVIINVLESTLMAKMTFTNLASKNENIS